MFPAPSPGSHPPDPGIAAEEITAIAAPLTLRRVSPADVPYPRIVPVALQKLGAVRKEIRMRYAIFFKDNAIFHLLEKPGDGAAYAHAWALIDIAVAALDRAGPIYLPLYNLAVGSYLLGLSGALKAWPVAGYKYPLWRRYPDRIDQLLCDIRPAKDNK